MTSVMNEYEKHPVVNKTFMIKSAMMQREK